MQGTFVKYASGFISFVLLAFVLSASQDRSSPRGVERTRTKYVLSESERALVEQKRATLSSDIRPFDQPAEAQEFHRAKRAPVGETAVPTERYITARERMSNMPVYSSASHNFVESEAQGAAAAALETWQALGPGNIGGRTRGLVIDPANPSIMYAGGVAGGIWKSTNAGVSWAPLDDFMANLAVSALVMDPGNSRTLYAGTGEGFFNIDAVRGAGIFKSTDAGSTWTQLAGTNNSNFHYVNDIVVSRTSSQRVYAATRDGVFQSLNGGTTWAQVHNPGANGCLDLAMRTDTVQDVVFASCGTFAQASVFLNSDAAGGGAWTSVLAEPNMGRTSIAIAPANQDTIYALASSTEAGNFSNGLLAVFRSIDGGASWTAQVRNTDATPLNTVLLTNPGFALGCFGTTYLNQGWYDNVIAVDPLNPDVVWVGGIDLFRSDDGGQSWGLASYWWTGAAQGNHADHHAIVFHPEYDGVTNKVLFTGNDGGVYRTDDALAATGNDACTPASSSITWTALNNNYGVTQFYHGLPYPNGLTYFGGTQDNGTIRGTNAGGSAWSSIQGGDGGYVAVDPTNTNILYAETTGISITKSTDGGTTFASATTGISDTGLFINPFVMDPSDSQRLWTSGQFMWRTVDGAGTWVRASAQLNGTVSAIAVSPTNPNRVLAGSDTGNIHRTDLALSADATTVWQSTQPRTGYVSSLAFHPQDEMTAYATYSTFGGVHVFRSTDGGASWVDIDGSGTTGIPDIPVHSIVVDPGATTVGNHLYVGTDLGVFTSTDAGAIWAVENTGFANVVTEALALDASGTSLYAFTHGRGAFKVDITPPGLITPRNPSPANAAANVDPTALLSWRGGDTTVTYDVYFGTTTTPPLVSSGQAETTYVPGLLNFQTGYFWRVVSRDSLGAQAAGPVWSFTTASECSELVTDGGFEAGNIATPWIQTSTNFGTPVCEVVDCGTSGARTGNWWVWFNGVSGGQEQASVEQSVTIPPGTGTLTFYLWINTSSGNGTDTVRALIDGVEVFSVLEGDATYTGGYTQVNVDVSAYADGVARALRFESTIADSTTPSNFYLDDVSLQGCTVPLPTPVPIGPTGTIGQASPAFSWNASAGATTYNLVVDNVTNGVNAINETGIATTTFTPSTPLAHGHYRWRVQAAGATGVSAFSSNLAFEIDTTAPGAVSDLSGTPQSSTTATPISPLTALSASGEMSATFSKEKAVDGNASTFWSTPGSAALQTEHLTLDLGSTRSVGRVRLQSRTGFPELFPRDFAFQLSADNVTFTPVHTEVNFAPGTSTAFTFDFTPVLGRYLRFEVTEPGTFSGNYLVQIEEIEVTEVITGGGILLSWTAPGDDGAVGQATSYEIKYSSTNIVTETDFNNATSAPGTPPSPQPSGGAESFLLTGLAGETSVYVAIRTTDDIGLTSLSNVPLVTSPGVAPDPVIDLSVSNPTPSSVDLAWTASGDDGAVGQASSYDIRYSTSVIDTSNFDAATAVASPPIPQTSGASESHTVTGLAEDTLYYFALKVSDELANKSTISNVVSLRTADGTPPSAISDLSGTQQTGTTTNPISPLTALSASGELAAAFKKEFAVDGNGATFWSTPGSVAVPTEQLTLDLGRTYSVGRVRLQSRTGFPELFPRDFQFQLSPDNVTFTPVHTEVNFAPGSSTEFTFDFPPSPGRYFRLQVTKPGTFSGTHYVQIEEIEVTEVITGGGVLLSWTAPGDDGTVGQATSYEIKYSTTNIVTETDFNNATLAPGTPPSPQASGSAESFLLTGVPGETSLYVAIRAADDAGLTSLSNVPLVSTPGVAPSAVTDLLASNPTGSSVELAWTASGDDGTVGQASSYDIRYSTSVIDASNFDSAAAVVSPPVPQASGVPEKHTVTGLAEDNLYYFALKVSDELSNTSAISNVVSLRTSDGTPPSAISDLSGIPQTNTTTTPISSLTAVSSSGQMSATFAKEKAVDKNASTFWSTPGSAALRTEHLTLDLGATYSVGRVRLQSRTGFPQLFPRDFAFQVSSDNVTFTPVHTEVDFAPGTSTAFTFNFTPALGRYLRLEVTEPGTFSNTYYVQIEEIEVTEVISGGGVLLRWTAPGDDGTTGQATSYEIKYSTTNIVTEADFNNATAAPGTPPTPKVSGGAESFLLTGAPGETSVYVAIRTADDAGLTSLSNVPLVSTPGVAPDAVADLAASNPTASSVDLAWTASGDDGTVGQATSYDIRYSTSVIDASNFDSATAVASPPAPQTSGASESHTVTGLTADTLYYFALKVSDELSNASTISNVVSLRTLDGIAPSAISDLSGTPQTSTTTNPITSLTAFSASGQMSATFAKEKAVDGNGSTFWSTPGSVAVPTEQLTLDLGATYSVGQVRLQSRTGFPQLFPRDFEFQMSSDNVTFTSVHTEVDFAPGTSTEFTFNFTPAAGRYLRFEVTEPGTFSGKYFVQIEEIEVTEVISGGGVLLSWTAPGDDGTTGQATSYEVKYSTTNIVTETDFNNATLPPGAPPSPKPSGGAESFLLTGAPGETSVYVAIRTTDDAGLTSLSNVPQVSTPGVAPDAVTDLSASNPTTSSVALAWTASGDDGTVGQATSYDIRYSTSAIDASNFGSATAVASPPAPQTSGASESHTVTGLAEDTLYYFALKVVDELSNASAISNVVSLRTSDGTPPSAIGDLSGIPQTSTTTTAIRPLTALSASGQMSATFAKEKAVDGNGSTFWSTPGSAALRTEHLTLDLGATYSVGRVRLQSRTGFPQLFPRDFEFQVSSDNVTFTPVHTEVDFAPGTSTAFTFNFTPALGRYLRFEVTEPGTFSNTYYVQIEEIEVTEVISGGGVLLSWTAPGDDGTTGQATSYEIKYSTTNIVTETDFNNATPALGIPPTPKASGGAESFLLNGVPGETSVYVAIRTADDAGLTSLSNVPQVSTPGVAPDAVTDLSASNPTTSSVALAWTASGDDGTVGQATSYDIRYSTSVIDASNFDAATAVASPPVPQTSGAAETHTVTGLTADTLYYFALKVVDELSSASTISNVVSLKTSDETAPSAISDLSGTPQTSTTTNPINSLTALSASGEMSATFSKEKAVDGNGSTFWSTPGSAAVPTERLTLDLGSTRSVGRVRLQSRTGFPELFPRDFEFQVSSDNVTFTPVHTEVDFAPGTSTAFTFDFTPAAGRYLRLEVTEPGTFAGVHYVQIEEIAVTEVISGGVLLSWTATGDNGTVGTATTYDVRYAVGAGSIVTDADFNAATEVVGEPSPKLSGTAESFVVTGLNPSTTYDIAVKVLDEAGNFATTVVTVTTSP